MPKPAYEVSKHGETSRSIYWQVGGANVHVLESFKFVAPKYRFVCLTCLLNDCKHVQAVQSHLDQLASEAAA